MRLRVFLDAHAGTDKKENDQRFGEQIDNARQQHKCQVSGLEHGKAQKTLGETGQEQDKGQKTQAITCVHEKPHRCSLVMGSVIWKRF